MHSSRLSNVGNVNFIRFKIMGNKYLVVTSYPFVDSDALKAIFLSIFVVSSLLSTIFCL